MMVTNIHDENDLCANCDSSKGILLVFRELGWHHLKSSSYPDMFIAVGKT